MNRSHLTPTQNRLSWACQLIAAVIMFQTLFFKFSGAPEPVFIFTTLGVEPWGRWGTGVAELIASVLLVWPRFIGFGALMSVGLMAGAIFSHLTQLGLVVMNDGGLLFGMAVVVMLCSLAVLWLHRKALLNLLARLMNK